MIFNYTYISNAAKKQNAKNNKKKMSRKNDPINEINLDSLSINKNINNDNNNTTEISYSSYDDIFDVEGIISGIVFSEILGKPRAKKPWVLK